MKLNGLKEEQYFNETALNDDTQLHIKVVSWGRESFVGLCSLDLENETFSQHHCHDKFRTIFDFKRFFESLKNGSIDIFNTLTMQAW